MCLARKSGTVQNSYDCQDEKLDVQIYHLRPNIPGIKIYVKC